MFFIPASACCWLNQITENKSKWPLFYTTDFTANLCIKSFLTKCEWWIVDPPDSWQTRCWLSGGARWAAGRQRPWRLRGGPEIALLLYYDITSQPTPLSWLPLHHASVWMSWDVKQLYAGAVSHTAEQRARKALQDATLGVLNIPRQVDWRRMIHVLFCFSADKNLTCIWHFFCLCTAFTFHFSTCNASLDVQEKIRPRSWQLCQNRNNMKGTSCTSTTEVQMKHCLQALLPSIPVKIIPDMLFKLRRLFWVQLWERL